MGFSPWGREESDTTEVTELAPMHGVLARDKFKEEKNKREISRVRRVCPNLDKNGHRKPQ